MPAFLKLKRFWFFPLILPAYILTSLAAGNPAATERFYSRGLYPAMSGLFGRISGLLPFSLAEWAVIAAPAALVCYITVSVRKIIRQKDRRRELAVRFAATILCIAGIISFWFTMFCGLNYHRESFASISGLHVRPSSPGELALLCGELVSQANDCAPKVSRDADNVMVLSFDGYYDAALTASSAYAEIGKQHSVLAGFCPRPKPVLASRAMSLANLVGVYTPYTFEANVNVDVPDYAIPSSMLHELAHFKGFMREDEANYISYITCMESGDDDFAYSGILLALIHTSSALYSADRDAYWSVMEPLDARVYADFDANSAYWRQFEGPVAQVSEKVNDVYLKTNRQQSGVKSYGEIVDLLLAGYRSRHGIE